MNDKTKIYYDYLIKNNLEQAQTKEERPYIGFVKIKISKYYYLIPLTSKSNKYSINHKYSIPAYDSNKVIPVLNNKTL